MNVNLDDVFADTVFWIATIVRADQHHARAQAWSQRVTGRLITTDGVLTETANALARPDWRGHVVALIDQLRSRPEVFIVNTDATLWNRGFELYRARADKRWGLTDCVSFEVMGDLKLTAALTADEHFQQAGFRALLLEDPQ